MTDSILMEEIFRIAKKFVMMGNLSMKLVSLQSVKILLPCIASL